MSTTQARNAWRAGGGETSGTASLESGDRADLVLDQLNKLPTLPTVATRLIAMTSDGSSHASDVIELVESDPALTARILSVARRSTMGIRPDAVTVEKAVVLLGFDAVRAIVLAIQVFDIFGPAESGRTGGFDRQEFWKHSLGVACAAQLLAAERGGSPQPEEAFVCGLLHDLGKLALDCCLPKSFDRVVRLCQANRGCLPELEQQIIGVDHMTAGRRLAERWNLPDMFVQCIWLHHHRGALLPPTVDHRDAINIVNLADVFVRERRIGFSGNFSFPDRSATIAREIGLTDEALGRVEAGLAPQIERRASIIGLDVLTTERVYLGALQTANDELGQLNMTLSRANASLRARSRFFDALRHLNTAAGAGASPRTVCKAAAGAGLIATESSGVLVFVDSLASRLRIVATHVKDAEATCETQPLDTTRVPTDLPSAAPHVESADASALDLPAPLMNRIGEPPYWCIPLAHGQRRLGGIVFAASTMRADRVNQARDELSVLTTAIGLAMADAEARAAATRLAEALAGVNVRMKNAEVELLRSRSLSMIAEMASGAAHELNNPLAVISGRSQLLREEVEDPRHRETLNVIIDHSRRCSAIVSELADFASPNEPRAENVNLGQLLTELRNAYVRDNQLADEQFSVQVPADLSMVHADRGHVRTIMGELVRNAIEAHDNRPIELAINCRRDVADDRVVIELADRGRGMTPEVQQRAFDPFFSHRPAGRGRGLGLSRAHRLAEINRGRLWLENREPSGTLACLALPASTATDAPAV